MPEEELVVDEDVVFVDELDFLSEERQVVNNSVFINQNVDIEHLIKEADEELTDKTTELNQF